PSKYLSSGHQIVNRNFGKGSQPYLNFKGWAIIFGHYRHTASNQETYIVAKSGTTEKIYSTLQINISATEDGEYNNQGPNHVWNECPSTAKNKSNIDSWGGCNMRYDSVGFDAYIPLNELVPDPSVNASWQFYIVKKVNSYMVYAPLILPFDLSPLNFHSGKISLTSGVNANRLTMVGTNVYRRKGPGASAERDGYFSTGTTYTRKNHSETSTAM